MKKRGGSKHKLSDDDIADDDTAKKSSKKSKKKRNNSPGAEDAEKPTDSGKGSKSSEKENKKKKCKKTAEMSDDDGTRVNDDDDGDGDGDDDGDDVDLEDAESDTTKGKRKQKTAEKSKVPDEMDSCTASADEVLNCEDEDDDAENSEKGKQSKRSRKEVKGSDSESAAVDDSLDRELKNLGKLPKLKIKANSGKMSCEEIGENNESSAAAETVRTKPVKRGLYSYVFFVLFGVFDVALYVFLSNSRTAWNFCTVQIDFFVSFGL